MSALQATPKVVAQSINLNLQRKSEGAARDALQPAQKTEGSLAINHKNELVFTPLVGPAGQAGIVLDVAHEFTHATFTEGSAARFIADLQAASSVKE